MIENIIHQETFSHSIDQMTLYVIQIKGDFNMEVQRLIEEKRIQTIFLLENQEEILNLENITKSLAQQSLDEKCETLFKEIYEAKKNIGLILSEGKNEALLFFAQYMILLEKKNLYWLSEQNFYQTLLKTEQEFLQNLIKNSPDTFGNIFLHTKQLRLDEQLVSSVIIHTDKPQHSEAIDLNPPFVGSQLNPPFLGFQENPLNKESKQDPIIVESKLNPTFPIMFIDSNIIRPDDKQPIQSETDTKIEEIQQSQVKNGNANIIQEVVSQEQEQTIKELAPPIQFQSFYQKYTIKCFK